MPTRPNILWLMTDEQRTDSLGAYGSTWASTPNLDRLAREGTTFRHAVTPAPVCGPARVSLFTGKCPHETGVWYNQQPVPDDLGALVGRFEQAGYRTASFGKQHGSARVFQTEERHVLSKAVHYFHYNEPYDEAAYNVVKYPPEPYPWIFAGRFPESAEDTSESIAISRAIDWLEQGGDEPFMLRVSFNGPHTPVAPPAPYDDMIDADAIAMPADSEAAPDREPKWLSESLAAAARGSRLTRDQVRRARQAYYGEVAFLDAQFGRLIAHLEATGKLDETIIAFVSDHGTHISDFDKVQKQTFYEPVVNVPFFFRMPSRVQAGRMIDTPVETRSLVPTLLDMAGLSRVDDASLAPSLTTTLEGGDADARPVFSAFTLGSFEMRPDDRLCMVRDGRWKLSLCLDPTPHDAALYDLQNDPYERQNLAGDAAASAIEQRLTQLIVSHVAGPN